VLSSKTALKAKKFTVHAPCHVSSRYGGQKTTYLESLTPVCLFTVQLLWGYDNDYEQFVDDNFL